MSREFPQSSLLESTPFSSTSVTNQVEQVIVMEKDLDPARFIILGEANPKTLTNEEFRKSSDLLYHASRRPNFHVLGEFNYKEEEYVNGATLGEGLYTTASRRQVENYATRRKGSITELMPYQARMLDLTSESKDKNNPVPKEIIEKWIFFAEPKINERIEYWEGKPQGCDTINKLRFLKVLMGELLKRDNVDLRKDILGTDSAHGAIPGSVVNNIWIEFCRQEGIDGLICMEGGEGDFSRQNDATYVFYALDKIGTFEDWHQIEF